MANLKILNDYLINKIDTFLDMSEHITVIIRKNNGRLIVDVEDRSRKLDIKLDDN